MTTEVRCERTDMLVSGCAHCRGLPDPEVEARQFRAALVRRGGWLLSEHPGRCVLCHQPFPPGTAITRDGDGWRGECCAEVPR